MIPGSHRDGIRAHEYSSVASRNLLRRGQQIRVSDEEMRTAVPIELAAGQISIHDGNLVHSSGANKSSRRRCGLAIRYIPASVRQREGLPGQHVDAHPDAWRGAWAHGQLADEPRRDHVEGESEVDLSSGTCRASR